MPFPLQGSLERVRPALVVMAIVPNLLLGANAQTVGRLARPEDTAWPARPAIVVQQPFPIPGAQAWMPTPSRLPNADPTRPPIVTTDPPDPTLAQPSALSAGRLPRAEDVAWPARPPVVQGVPVPVPGAVRWLLASARDPNTDPTRPPIVVADPPDATLAQSSSLPIGRLPRDEDTTRPASPARVQCGAQPLPAGGALATYAPRDQVVVIPDRLALTQVVIGAVPVTGATSVPVGAVKLAPPDHTWPLTPIANQQPLPSASVWLPTPPKAANTDPLRPLTMVSDPPDPTLAIFSAQLVGRLSRLEDTTRPARPALTQMGAQPIPGALVAVVGGVHAPAATLPDRLAPPQVVAGQTPVPLAIVCQIGIVHDGDRLPLGVRIVPGSSLPADARAIPIGRVSGPVVALQSRLSPPTIVLGSAPRPAAMVLQVRALLAAPVTHPTVLHASARSGTLHADDRTDALHGAPRVRSLSTKGPRHDT